MTTVYSLHGLFCYVEDWSHLDNSRAPQSSLRQTVWLWDCGRISQWVFGVCIYVRGWSTGAISTLGQRLKLSSLGKTGNPRFFCILRLFICHHSAAFLSSDRDMGCSILGNIRWHRVQGGNSIPSINFMVPTFFRKVSSGAGRRQLILAVTF